MSSSVSEDVGVVMVTIDRNGGLVGDIRVNYSADDREAFESSDYTLSTNCTLINIMVNYLITSSTHP